MTHAAAEEWFAFDGILYTPRPRRFHGSFTERSARLSGILLYDTKCEDHRTEITGVILNEETFCIGHQGRAARNWLLFAHHGTVSTNNYFRLYREGTAEDLTGRYEGKVEFGEGGQIGLKDPMHLIEQLRRIEFYLGLAGSVDVELDLRQA